MEQNSTFEFRKGTEIDIPFLVEAIVAAEKSGSEIFSYSKIFEMEESKVRNILAEIIAEDTPGQELCFSEYLIAAVNGAAVGAVAGWVEGSTGQRGGIIKGTLLNFFFPKENMEKAFEKKNVLDELRFEPTLNSLVIDICYSAPEWRGHGIVTNLIQSHLRNHLEQNPELRISQIDVMKTNQAALRTYSRLGYNVIAEKKSNNPDLLRWLPSDTLLILEKQLLKTHTI